VATVEVVNLLAWDSNDSSHSNSLLGNGTTSSGSIAVENSDRLVALSGIARKCENDLLGDYLAGIWEKKLPYSLLYANTFTANVRGQRFQILFDTNLDKQLAERQQLFCFAIAGDRRRSRRCSYTGLPLRSSNPIKGAFERVGIFWSYHSTITKSTSRKLACFCIATLTVSSQRPI
jgi:hypothetical protein